MQDYLIIYRNGTPIVVDGEINENGKLILSVDNGEKVLDIIIDVETLSPKVIAG